MRELVFISLEAWDDIWRRNQFVCAELARRHQDLKILFVTPPRGVLRAVLARDMKQLKPVAPWSPPGLPAVTVCTPTKYFPNTYWPTRRVNAWHLAGQIRRAARAIGMDRPLVWVNDHSTVEMIGALGDRCGLVYDITDDWTAFEQPDWLTERIRRQDATLCRTSDAVIVCSPGLAEAKASLVDSARLHLVPNGVDADHYATVMNDTGPLPDAAARWPRPVYGYSGSVHADRVDIDLVESLARQIDGTLVFVGPNMLSEVQARRMTSPGNVILHGPVPYSALPQYMRAFDACIVPHRVTAFTESLNPIKLWDYLATGKPVVSTPVAGFRDYGHLVSLATTAEEMAAALRACRSEPSDLAERRRTESRRHSWASRVDQIEAVLSPLWAGRPSQGVAPLRRPEIDEVNHVRA